MKLTRKTLDRSQLCHSAPGVPDVRRISCTELAGSIAAFSKKYLGNSAEIICPSDQEGDAVALSPTEIGHALRATIDTLSLGSPVKLSFIPSIDELCIRIEAAGIADRALAVAAVEAWRAAGFKLRRLGLSITLSISYDEGLSLVARESDTALLERLIYIGYYGDLQI